MSEVKQSYGYNGNVSVAPPMILKLMLDWLWFLGLDLDSEIPDHSVLNKVEGFDHSMVGNAHDSCAGGLIS